MDAFSRILFINYDVTEINITRENLAERYFDDKLDSDTFPLTYQTIYKYQHKYNEVVEKLKRANYHNKYFCGGWNTFMLIYKNNKISAQKIIWRYVVNWYHTYILYPGMERTESTINKQYYWNNLRYDISICIKVCNTCQKNNKQNFNYVKLPAKEAEAIPWEIFSLDIIGPYKIRIEGHDDPIMIKYLTMIEPETWWFEIVKYNDK